MTKALDETVELDGQRASVRDHLERAGRAKARVAVLHALPIELALRVATELGELDSSVDGLVELGKLDLGGAITGAHEPWARRTLAELSLVPESDRMLALFALLAIARAGGTIERDWEPLFPSWPGGYSRALYRPYVDEIVRALPPGRADDVAAGAIARDRVNAAGTALALLRAHDDEALARRFLGLTSAAWSEARLRTSLLQIAAERPGITRALADAPAPSLTVASRLRPEHVDELDEVRREQLRLACDRWEGTVRPLAERLAPGDPSFSVAGTCEWRVLADADGPRYDAWLLAGDSGTYFVAGTTQIAATRIQGGVRTDPADAVLAAALDRASDE